MFAWKAGKNKDERRGHPVGLIPPNIANMEYGCRGPSGGHQGGVGFGWLWVRKIRPFSKCQQMSTGNKWKQDKSSGQAVRRGDQFRISDGSTSSGRELPARELFLKILRQVGTLSFLLAHKFLKLGMETVGYELEDN